MKKNTSGRQMPFNLQRTFGPSRPFKSERKGVTVLNDPTSHQRVKFTPQEILMGAKEKQRDFL